MGLRGAGQHGAAKERRTTKASVCPFGERRCGDGGGEPLSEIGRPAAGEFISLFLTEPSGEERGKAGPFFPFHDMTTGTSVTSHRGTQWMRGQRTANENVSSYIKATGS